MTEQIIEEALSAMKELRIPNYPKGFRADSQGVVNGVTTILGKFTHLEVSKGLTHRRQFVEVDENLIYFINRADEAEKFPFEMLRTSRKHFVLSTPNKRSDLIDSAFIASIRIRDEKN